MKKLQNRKGFTLVELLIVMAIIGILVLLAVPRFTKSTQAANIRAMQNNTRALASAVAVYYADKGDMPRTDTMANFLADLNSYIDKAKYEGTPQPKNSSYDLNAAKDSVVGKMTGITEDPGIEGVKFASNAVTFEVKFK